MELVVEMKLLERRLTLYRKQLEKRDVAETLRVRPAY
jgi:hypothetical protein